MDAARSLRGLLGHSLDRCVNHCLEERRGEGR